MEIEVKQRNRRRKRAQRMQQQLRDKANQDESEPEDATPKKPPRPPNRRKKQKELLKEPLCEEDIVDGFSILQFRSYEDLELVLKISTKENIKRLTEIERPKIAPKSHFTNHILVHNNHSLTLNHDPATSDDSGRASERLTGSSVAPRDADSSRDRLSDASSRCSSGKGYICDSEGEDDKGSDASSVLFGSGGGTPATAATARKHELPGALPPSLPGAGARGGGSPVPAPTPPSVATPSPAPAHQPPLPPSATAASVAPPPASAIGQAATPIGQAATPIGASVGVVVPVVTTSGPPIGTVTPITQTVTPIQQQVVVPEKEKERHIIEPTVIPPHPPYAAHHPTHHSSSAQQVPPPAVVQQQTPPQPISLVPPTSSVAPQPQPTVPAVAAVAAHRRVEPQQVTSGASAVPAPAHYHHQYHQQPLYAPYAHAGGVSVSSYAPPTTYNAPPYSSTVASTTVAPPPLVSAAPQPMVSVASSTGEREKPVAPVAPTVVPPARVSTPQRERESYSVSSLSRSSNSSTVPTSHTQPITTTATPPAKQWGVTPLAAPLATPLAPPTAVSTGGSRLSPAVATTRPTPPLHPAGYATAGAPPIFPSLAPPTVVTSQASGTVGGAPANPNPFSAESLFQTNQADMLRRELDNRFLASSQDRTAAGPLGAPTTAPPPPYLRTEMHQHQHHHTHVHQHHTTSLLPPPTAAAAAASALFPSQMPLTPLDKLAARAPTTFKDIPKLGSVESPFYRQNLGLPNYPGYTPGLLGHHGLTAGPTPFVPPNHLPTFQPKPITPQDPTKPKIMKSGKWNAMHVRVAWEIYHHQQKSGEAKGALAAAAAATKSAGDLLRPPTHLFSPGVHVTAASRQPPHDLSPFSAMHRTPGGFDQPPHHPGSLFTTPPGHIGKSPFSTTSSMSPFTRYSGAPLSSSSSSPFSVSPFGARETHLGLGQLHHDPWRSLQRTMPGFPPAVNPLPPTLPDGRMQRGCPQFSTWLRAEMSSIPPNFRGLPPPAPAPWSIKPDPMLEQREREAREREERERERLRREREERERREREEKQRRLEQQQQQERERERREKERREMERREMEKQREREREMMLHQQRMAESAAKQLPAGIRDRSPLRNGQPESEVRVKEEPKKEQEELLARADPRYHPYLRHPPNLPPPPSMLDRSRMLPPTLPPHYPSSAAHWPPPTDSFYRYSYNPLMDAAMRAQEERERATLFSHHHAAAAAAAAAYHHPLAAAHHQLRAKDPNPLLHLRGGPGPPAPPTNIMPPPPPPTAAHKLGGATPPVEKKEEPR